MRVQRHWNDVIDRVSGVGIGDGLAKNQPQGFGEGELVAVFKKVYRVFYTAPVSASGMNPGETGREFQAGSAEMTGGCVGKGLGTEATMRRPQRGYFCHACIAEVGPP